MDVKVAVVGLDGVSWNIVKRIVDEGYFCSLAEVFDNSLKAYLTSTDPPWTPPAWTSIATSVNPGKHGIYSFYNVKRLNEGFQTTLVTGREACYPRVHEILALLKVKNLAANLPATYYMPSYLKEYSVVVSDWLSPSIRVNNPLYSYLAEAFSKNIVAKWYRDVDKLCKKMGERIQFITRALEKAILSFKPRLVFTVFSEFDWIMHNDKGFLEGTTIDRYKHIFEYIDKYVKKLKKSNYIIAVVSDHGFRMYKQVFYPQTYLNRYCNFKSGDIGYSWQAKSTLISKLAGFIRRYPALRGFVRRLMSRIYRERSSLRSIPYDYVQILIPDPHYMYLAPGIDRHHIIDLFNKTEYVKAYDKYEVYKGGYCVEHGPDIILKPRHDDLLIARGSGNEFYRDDVLIPGHHYLGVFSIEEHYYKDIVVSAHDVLPIVLGYLNLPIPSDTDSDLTLLEKLDIDVKFMNIRSRWLIASQIVRIRF